MAAREGMHEKPTAPITMPSTHDTSLMQHREWSENHSQQTERDVRLCVVEGLCKQLLEHQREQTQTLKQLHMMLEHLYHEHNRNEMRRRNYAIRSKNPIRFMPDSMVQTGSPPRTELYDLLNVKQQPPK
jgi:hypothetical protein